MKSQNCGADRRRKNVCVIMENTHGGGEGLKMIFKIF